MIITSIALITLDVREAGPITGSKSIARDALSPVASVADRVFSPVGDWVGGITRAGSLRSENERLRRDLEEAQGSEAKVDVLESQLAELSALLDIPFVEDSDAIAARVVSGAPGNFEWTVRIDKGKSSGVGEDMAVVTGAGLVGKVVDVTQDSATVRLITDPDSGVDVVTADYPGPDGEPTRSTGFAKGRTGSDLLRLTGVGPDARVEEGMEIYTSGRTTSLFPARIPVGRVVEVEKRSPEQEILLEPIVNLDSLEYVKVVPAAGSAPLP
ncbi:MAG TPA: rod shape-determining protein MreC [Acidimicrobiia bacterium]